MSASDLFPSLKYLAFSAVRRTKDYPATRKALNTFLDKDITDLNFKCDLAINRYYRTKLRYPLWVDIHAIITRHMHIDPHILSRLGQIGSFAALICIDRRALSADDIIKAFSTGIPLFNSAVLIPLHRRFSAIGKGHYFFKELHFLALLRSRGAVNYLLEHYPDDLLLQGQLIALTGQTHLFQPNHTFLYSYYRTAKLYLGDQEVYYTKCRNRCLKALYAWLLCAKRLPLIRPLPRIIADYVYNSIVFTEEWSFDDEPIKRIKSL